MTETRVPRLTLAPLQNPQGPGNAYNVTSHSSDGQAKQQKEGRGYRWRLPAKFRLTTSCKSDEEEIASLARVVNRLHCKNWYVARGKIPPAAPMHPAVQHMISEWFDAVDEDGSRTLEYEELMQALKAAQIPADEATIKEMIELMDFNKDGVIGWDEFNTFMADEIMNGKNLLTGEYMLPSGTTLNFGVMIGKLRRNKLMKDILEGSRARLRWVEVAKDPARLNKEVDTLKKAAQVSNDITRMMAGESVTADKQSDQELTPRTMAAGRMIASISSEARISRKLYRGSSMTGSAPPGGDPMMGVPGGAGGPVSPGNTAPGALLQERPSDNSGLAGGALRMRAAAMLLGAVSAVHHRHSGGHSHHGDSSGAGAGDAAGGASSGSSPSPHPRSLRGVLSRQFERSNSVYIREQARQQEVEQQRLRQLRTTGSVRSFSALDMHGPAGEAPGEAPHPQQRGMRSQTSLGFSSTSPGAGSRAFSNSMSNVSFKVMPGTRISVGSVLPQQRQYEDEDGGQEPSPFAFVQQGSASPGHRSAPKRHLGAHVSFKAKTPESRERDSSSSSGPAVGQQQYGHKHGAPESGLLSHANGNGQSYATSNSRGAQPVLNHLVSGVPVTTAAAGGMGRAARFEHAVAVAAVQQQLEQEAVLSSLSNNSSDSGSGAGSRHVLFAADGGADGASRRSPFSDSDGPSDSGVRASFPTPAPFKASSSPTRLSDASASGQEAAQHQRVPDPRTT